VFITLYGSLLESNEHFIDIKMFALLVGRLECIHLLKLSVHVKKYGILQITDTSAEGHLVYTDTIHPAVSFSALTWSIRYLQLLDNGIAINIKVLLSQPYLS
jgi:hypothetical protein